MALSRDNAVLESRFWVRSLAAYGEWPRERSAVVLWAAHGRAHGKRVSRAYNRSDMLERRRPVMDEWAAFLAGEAEAAAKASASSAKVVSVASRQKRP
jgi:hypothetical protein